ncbi:hypothetical protein MES4922_40196 [Mesorhizobium ventifaucium]|uniref:Uncharacterized protein n=1 Tax=Mesorhizobium ventifaucium TaxID=666020 RepID=A0ABM9E842_9HYPH|nr:hypothetical protein MES4922_40196 [Mesorhizobium ventifaucium]
MGRVVVAKSAEPNPVMLMMTRTLVNLLFDSRLLW